MQDYTELICRIKSENIDMIREILVAELAELGFESFSEEDSILKAYITNDLFDFESIKNLQVNNIENADVEYEYIDIKTKNWNEEWENNFSPIVVDDRCVIRAPFHTDTPKTEFEIVIMPKMSFGTGHHATTFLMIKEMLNMDFKGKKVLDMGCGTGILAILAEMRGATDIVAIDNNDWAYENALENFEMNSCKNIRPILGDGTDIPEEKYDIILANINRNVLLEDMKVYASKLKPHAILLLSGIYEENLELIREEAEKQDLVFIHNIERNDWVAATFHINGE